MSNIRPRIRISPAGSRWERKGPRHRDTWTLSTGMEGVHATVSHTTWRPWRPGEHPWFAQIIVIGENGANGPYMASVKEAMDWCETELGKIAEKRGLGGRS